LEEAMDLSLDRIHDDDDDDDDDDDLDVHYLVIFSICDYITYHIQFPRCNVSKPLVLTL